jgi:Ca-activated chloride channel homolog
MKINPNDPKWTAYVLGELDGDDRTAMDALVETSPEAQALVEELRMATMMLKDELAAQPQVTLSAAQRAAVHAAAAPRVHRWTGFRVARWATGLAAAGLILATTLTPSLLRSRRATYEQSPAAVTVQNVPEAPYTETQPVRQSQARLKAQSAPVDSGLVPQFAQNEREQEAQDKEDKEDKEDKKEELQSAFAKDLRREADSNRIDEFRGVVGGALQSAAAEPAAPSPIARAIAPIAAPAPALADRPFRPPFNTEAYDRITDNPFIRVSQDPLATFSIDVDTASYANVRRFINRNQLPPKDAVRIEEMVNYFTYDYPQPAGPHPILAQMEVASAPWSPQHRLVRIGIKGKDLNVNRRPASNLVFLIDVSGSMQPSEKLPLLKTAMKMLVENLTENDRVSMIVYAGASGMVLPPTSGDRKDVILRALDNLEAGGSTNGALGIQLAYSLAAENYIPRGTNRVILATDGDFNVGVTNQGDLIRLIEDKAKSGVFLSVLGFGLGNLKDSTLEKLADSGNGNYAYIDTLNEARKVLVEQMGGTLVTIAKDVKIQIEFNPAEVNAYRLIGYENRVLRNEDFNNDLKDAGDMGAGHTVTAMFEVVPAEVDIVVPGVDPLKYQTPSATVRSSSARETLTLKVRYKDPEGSESKLLEVPLVDSGKSFNSATTDFRFAASVAAFGMILRDSPYKGNTSIGAVLDIAEGSRGQDRNGYRAEFIGLVNRARSLGR